MAWSAVVRRDATTPIETPARRLQLESLRSCEGGSKGIAVAVVDANALISFDSSARLLSLACSSPFKDTRLVTVQEVLEEVRAPDSRFHLSTLPCSLDCIDPSDEAMQRVVKFARETGDLASLSDVDLKILALTYMLEEQTYGSAHLRTQPPPVCVAQVRGMRERDLPGWGSNVENLEEWEQFSQEPDTAIEEGSHILGLRNLSLDTKQQGDVFSDEGHKSTTDKEGLIYPLQIEQMHFEPNFITSACQEELSSTGIEDAQGSLMPSLLDKNHLDVTQGAVSNEEKGEKDLQNTEEQDVQEGRDWQRAVSRSTRRKHDKRAARAAMKNLSSTVSSPVERHQENIVASQAHQENSDAICNSIGLEYNDARESMLDEINDIEDGEISDEDGLSVCEASVVKGTRAISSQDYESEESWTLHSLSMSKVACITADFPMQNVLLQIGLRVVSPNGLQIQRLQRWALKCEACRNVTSDVGRIFCPRCGNGGTLYKVSLTIGANGIIHTGTRKRFNIRGTKYSLPLPKGGRQGFVQNPVLREDQLPKNMLHRKKKATKHDFTSPAELFVLKGKGKKEIEPPLREALAIFSGKRNPNRPHSKQRG